MKKIMILSSLLLVSMFAAAQITGTSQITLTSAGQPDKYVRFVMSDSYSDAVDPAGDVEAANPGGVYVYKVSDESRWTQWASNAYSDNIVIGFKACDNTHYVLNFSSFSGIVYSLYDLQADGGPKEIKVKADTEDYGFDIEVGQKNQTINNRFVINYVPVDPTALAACFIDKHLTITNNPWSEGKIVVCEDAAVDPECTTYAGSLTDIDLTSLTAGKRYFVKFYPTAVTTGEPAKKLVIVP